MGFIDDVVKGVNTGIKQVGEGLKQDPEQVARDDEQCFIAKPHHLG